MNRLVAHVILGATAALLTPIANTQADEPGLQRWLVQAVDRPELRSASNTLQSPLTPLNLSPVSLGVPSRDRSLVQDSPVAPNSELSSMGPDPTVAWLMALGFLGLVVMRRIGASSI
jgi:hypothetical protein